MTFNFKSKLNFLQYLPNNLWDKKGHLQNALLALFLNRFRQTIARWKGLEVNFSDSLPDITFSKALHVIPYKNKTTSRKIAYFSGNITVMK